MEIREFDQPAILLDKFIGFQGWKPPRVKQQILFHFILDDFRKHEPAEPRRAQGQRGLVEAPGRNDPSGDYIGVEKKPNSPSAGHF